MPSKFKSWGLLIKIGLFVLFAWMIYQQLFQKNQITQVWSDFESRLSEGPVHLFILAVILMPLNWLLETMKWRLLLPQNDRPAFRQCVKAILGGITLSLLTPNRIGEYGGRVLFIERNIRWSGVVATIVGSYSQNLVSVLFGILGIFAIFMVPDQLTLDIQLIWFVLIAAGMIVLTTLYFRLDLVYRLIKPINFPKFLSNAKKHLSLIAEYSNWILSSALGLALVRYLVFSFQFLLLLVFFGVDVPPLWMWFGITVIYLFHTGVPLPPFVDIMARSEIALLLWQMYDPNELSVMSASLCIWIINLATPALIGLIAIENMNLTKSIGYAQNENP